MRATATKPFIVQADARLFKGKNKLSRGGQSVYMVMRSLADGSTGELAINGHALSSRTICEQGGFSRWTWLKYRKELLAAGLLYEQRERVSVYDHKAERMRTVLAETHYFVPRQAEVPKTAKKPTILLESGSRTVEEPDPQSIQIPRNLPPVAVGVVPLVVPEGTGRESSSPPPKPEPMIRQPRPLQEKAQTKGQTGRNAAIAEWMKANDLDGPTWTAAVVTHIEARRETKKTQRTKRTSDRHHPQPAITRPGEKSGLVVALG